MKWVGEVKEATSDNISITIVGNKCDEEKKRVIIPEEAANYACENGCLYAETSAVTGQNIDDIFKKIAYTISYQVENGILKKEDPNAIRVKKEPAPAVEPSGKQSKCAK